MLSQGVIAKLNALNPKSIVKQIGSRDWRFYSFTPPMLSEVLGLGRDMTTSFMALSDSDKTHRATKSKETRNADKSGFESIVIETEVAPTSIQHIAAAAEARKKAASELYEAVVGKTGRNFLARAICDCLREDFPQGATPEDADEFWRKLDLEAVVLFVQGAMEANALVLRPFLAKVSSSLRAKFKAVVEDRLKALASPSDTRASTSPEPSSSASSPESSVDPTVVSPGTQPIEPTP